MDSMIDNITARQMELSKYGTDDYYLSVGQIELPEKGGTKGYQVVNNKTQVTEFASSRLGVAVTGMLLMQADLDKARQAQSILRGEIPAASPAEGLKLFSHLQPSTEVSP